MTATPKPPFPFTDFQAATTALQRSIADGDRYVLLTGESGAGKTTVLRAVQASLDRCHVRVIYFNLARLSPAGLVRVLARRLRVPPSRSQPETVHTLVKVLREEPLHTWLWIDEAQLVPDDTFAELRTLVETDLDGTPAVSVLLVGLPELRERLQAPRLFPIWRRLEARVHITGLFAEEAGDFVARHVGADTARRFTPAGLEALCERSRGLPGLLAVNLRQLVRALPDGPLDTDQVENALQRWDRT